MSAVGRSFDVAVAVLGAGASGSSMVRALADARVLGPVLLVDDERSPIQERVWGSWMARDDVDLAVHGSWRSVVVASERDERVLGLRDHRYVLVRGGDVRRCVDDALVALDGERLRATALRVREEADAAIVTTSAGDVRARLVLDSVGLLGGRPPEARTSMRFHGVEVRASSPVFDPRRVTLMDFRVPQRGGLAFAHVVPWAADQALVELTRYGSAAVAEDADDLRDLLVAMPGDLQVVRREQGHLLLRPRARRPRSSHALAIGTPAGVVRASTGYGYQRARLDAAGIAADLVAGRPPRGALPPRRFGLLDAVFLDLVETQPDTVRDALVRLFARNPAGRVLRFLDGVSSPGEDAALVASLPFLPFTRAALVSGVRWARFPGFAEDGRAVPADGRNRP